MRSLGIDLGTRRIGVAMSDSSGTIATPLTVVTRNASHNQDHRKIQELIDEYEVDCVVVGMPISMSGKIGPAGRAAQDEIEELKVALSVPVYSYDERLTSKTANESMMQANMKAQARRRIVDKIAAAVMLQGWLEHVDRNQK
ncbi:MAG: Holliday junction resolvase RuvX [Actinobacteria bacterium]|jgi:putative holliday junction resolvase|nr:Holliday junction resolvase RuvX [Actinomycetota bacterium]